MFGYCNVVEVYIILFYTCYVSISKSRSIGSTCAISGVEDVAMVIIDKNSGSSSSTGGGSETSSSSSILPSTGAVCSTCYGGS
jgi:hypothetical protein